MGEMQDIHWDKIEVVFEAMPPLEKLGKVHGLEQLVRQGNRVSFTLHGGFEALFKTLAGNRIVNFTSHEPSLEEVFLAYYREGEDSPAEPAAGAAPE